MICKAKTVSLIVVARNEERFISRALQSLISQDYPSDLLEIIFVDGISEDSTVKIAVEILKSSCCKYKILKNPKKTLAVGWNLAIKEASGEYVCRIDAHGELSKSYIKTGIAVFSEAFDPTLICVGGILENVGEGFWGKVAQYFFASKFGVGDSPFRSRMNARSYTDTAAMGIYRRSIFSQIGYFDENLDRNQDIALHKKMIAAGYRFVTEPSMVFVYHVRSNFVSLMKKAYQDGYWVVYSKSSYLRHKVPFAFVAYLFFLFLRRFRRNTSFAEHLPLLLYLILCFRFAIKDGCGSAKLLLLILFPAYHVAYGIGSLAALIKMTVGRMRFVRL